MAKEVKVPSKAQMARDERKWQAERMVMDGMKKTPQFKAAVKEATKHLEEGERAARRVIQKPMKKGKRK